MVSVSGGGGSGGVKGCRAGLLRDRRVRYDSGPWLLINHLWWSAMLPDSKWRRSFL